MNRIFVFVLFSFFCFLMGLLLLVFAFSVSVKCLKDSEKLSPFECGFMPQTNSRTPFSFHFFLLGILFLMFDVELVLLFPFLLLPHVSPLVGFVFWVVLVLLLLGLLVEWAQGILDWVNLL